MVIARYDTGESERYRAWGLFAIGMSGELICALAVAVFPSPSPGDIATAVVLFVAFAAASYFLPASALLLVEVTETEMRWQHLFGGGVSPLSSVQSAEYSVRYSGNRPWPHITIKFTDRRSLQFTARQPNTAVFLNKLEATAPNITAVTLPPPP